MKVDLPLQLTSVAAGLFALLVFIYYIRRWKLHTHDIRSKPPQPSGAWPFIGHLHLLRGIPHIVYGILAEKYGPIFMVKLGVHQAIVVSTPETAKDCLGANDKVFVDRPRTIFVDHLGFNAAMLGFSPYGRYWREMRKITTVKLLSSHRLEMLKHVRTSEIRSAIKDIHENYCEWELLDIKEWFKDLNLNVSVRLIVGKSLKELYKGDEYNKCRKVLRDFFNMSGVFVPADTLPYLRRLDIGGREKAMKRAAKEIDHVAQRWLDEHKRRRVPGKAKEKQDFMDVMLDHFQTGEDIPSQFDADTIIKATSMAMILGGTNTLAVTLTWALSLLLNNKDALKKAQDELDVVVGKEKQVTKVDLKNLVYLQAVLKETMRLYPAAPLSLPRVTVAHCTVRGYHIPARTRLFVNLYKIHRDPEVWPNPLEFLPERFLTTHKDYDMRGQNFGYMPFGSGKRICPAISYSLLVMQFTLANLLHGFEITTPSGKGVDMTEGLGLTNLKTTPLEVIITPRLPSNLYNDPTLAVN